MTVSYAAARKQAANPRHYEDGRPALEWTLTPAEYAALIAQPCWYCGGSLPSRGYGLDRIDELAGYKVANVLPCCRWCNTYRMGWFKPDEWRAAIVEHERRTGAPFRWGDNGHRPTIDNQPNEERQVRSVLRVLRELVAGPDLLEQKLWLYRRQLEHWQRVILVAQTDKWRSKYAFRIEALQREIERRTTS